MILPTLVIIILSLCAFNYFWKNKREIRLLEKIPGPPGWPILGNLPSFLVSRDKLLATFHQWSTEYHPVYKFWLLQIPIVAIADPVNAEIMLTNTQNIKKSFIYEYLMPWLGSGLLTSYGAKWQRRRKILTPAFHFNILKKYCDIMVENGEKTIEFLKAKDESVQDLMSFIAHHTLNVICESAMGTSIQGKEDKQHDFRNGVNTMGEILIYRFSRPWMSTWLFDRIAMGKRQKKVIHDMHEFGKNVISERQKYHENTGGRYLKQMDADEDSKSELDEGINMHKKKRLAMLDLLIAANKNGEQIDIDGIREEVDTFIFEGYDTTYMAILYSLLMIAEHKDVQARIRDEVNEIMNKSEGKMGLGEIQQMNYLERCIKETLRIYSPVPNIMRNLTEDLKLKDYLVPKGTTIYIHLMEINRDPHYWPDPLKFDPDRFLPGKIEGRHPFSYIPFSAGPRNCIGQKYAMTETKALIAQIVQNFYLEPIDYAHEVSILLDMVLRPAHPVKMKFIRIENDTN